MQFSAALALVGAFSAAQAYTFVGCSATAVSSASTTNMYMSYGLCEEFCKKEACGAPTVMALSGTLCHCGKLPDQNDLVDEALCSTLCPGYGDDTCMHGRLDSGPFVFANSLRFDRWWPQHLLRLLHLTGRTGLLGSNTACWKDRKCCSAKRLYIVATVLLSLIRNSIAIISHLTRTVAFARRLTDMLGVLGSRDMSAE